MAQAAVKIEDVQTEAILPVEPRRFQIPDLDTHGGWMVDRMCETFTHFNPRSAANSLRSIIYSNEYMFLFLPNAVGLAQTVRDFTFEPLPVVRERFVWCRDRTDKAAQIAAGILYEEFSKWARHQGCEIMIVEESSDVPHEEIRERLGRVYSRQQQFVRF